LYAAHLTPYLQRATEELNTRIQKSQQENTVIFGQINDQRAEIERLLNGLQHVVEDVEGSVDAMRSGQQTNFDGLRDDVWQMEREVARTR
jgi:kinetochore protein NNF1